MIDAAPASPRREPRLPVKHLTRGSDIRRVLNGGRRSVQTRMVVYVMPGEHGSRAGFICGRKVGGAVARNRARRLLKEAWRVCFPRVPEGLDIVFVARPAIRGANLRDAIGDMSAGLVGIGAVAR